LPGLSFGGHGVESGALPKSKWQAEVTKMIQNYKAPVASEDVAAIVDYLTRTKGAE